MEYHSISGYRVYSTCDPKELQDSPVVIFIPGLLDSKDYFCPIIHALSSTYRCFVYDLESMPQVAEDVFMSTLAGNITAMIENIGASSTILVGNDLGTSVALYIASRFSERNLGVVGICPVLLPSSQTGTQLENWASIAKHDGMEALSGFLVATSMGAQTTERQKEFVREQLLRTDNIAISSYCTAVLGAPEPKYPDVRCPVLIISGDSPTAVQSSAQILKMMGSRSKTLDVLPGVGSWPCVEASGAVSKGVLNFAGSLGQNEGDIKVSR